jgi:hypothetical protein
VIRADEEPQMNITLRNARQTTHAIAGLDPLHLVNMEVVYRRRVAVRAQSRGWIKPRWILLKRVLGIFSFSQFVMCNDIRNRAED